jgi:penicillin amidase
MTVTGKPILANDPHRPVQIPSLRKTVHLVAPGWDAIGAGEPALPGIALGHNQRIAFGFTIVGVDQVDLYAESLNPGNPRQYRYRGAWKDMEVEREPVAVKGPSQLKTVELLYTVHGPVLHLDRNRNRAYALRWVGSEPGTAGYLAGLALARAQNWREFLAAVERYKVPSENIVYADVDGNIGWHATGMTPIRQGWSGLFPVPGSGEYEWAGFRKMSELPWVFNPPSHFVATANHNILPADYKVPLGYEWALPFRYHRITEMLGGGRFSVRDFEKMQQDVTSLPARRFQQILKRWNPKSEEVAELLAWDTRLTTGSRAAAIYEAWIAKLPAKVFGPDLGPKVDLGMLLKTLDEQPNPQALAAALTDALAEIKNRLGADRREWAWGKLHQIYFRHPLDQPGYNRGPIPRPGDGFTVNSTSGPAFQQNAGASYREILDLGEWDRSTMTNVPGESGDPASPHYSDLLEDWAAGRYHPMPFTRKAVELATTERIQLVPAPDSHTQSAAAQTAAR